MVASISVGPEKSYVVLDYVHASADAYIYSVSVPFASSLVWLQPSMYSAVYSDTGLLWPGVNVGHIGRYQ